MAKKGMSRPDSKERSSSANRPKNEVPPVPELQGKAKTGKEKAKPITEK